MSATNSSLFHKELILGWLLISLSGFHFITLRKVFVSSKDLELFACKGRSNEILSALTYSNEILSALEAEIDSLFVTSILP